MRPHPLEKVNQALQEINAGSPITVASLKSGIALSTLKKALQIYRLKQEVGRNPEASVKGLKNDIKDVIFSVWERELCAEEATNNIFELIDKFMERS